MNFLKFITFFLFINFLFYKSYNYQKNNLFLLKLWWILPGIIFFIESFSTYNFFNKIGGGSLHHWQIYISILELIQGGGYLLWDIPSQYGFLNILFIYLIPISDPWLKLYFANSIITFTASLIIFKIIWNNRNIYWYFLSILFCWIILFVISGGPGYDNFSVTPSLGPLRYFWVIFICYLLFYFRKFEINFQLKIILPFWIVGSFWSIMSAICINFLILTYFTYVLFSKENIELKIKNIIIYLFTFLISISIIYLFYNYKLGVNPDLLSFFDFAINGVNFHGKNLGTIFNYKQTILIPLLILSYLVLNISKIKDNKFKFICISFISCLFGILLYSFDAGSNLTFLKQFYLFIFILFLILNFSEYKTHKVFVYPIIVITLLFTLTNPKTIINFINKLNHQDYFLKNINFNEDIEFNEILNKIEPKTIPVIYIEPGRYLFFNSRNYYINNNQTININRNYFPSFISAGSLIRLNEKSANKYLQRWLDRNLFNKGWFINSINEHWHFDMDKRTNKILIKNGFKISKRIDYKNLKAILYEKID